MSITREIIDTCYIHAQHTGNAPYVLRISEELWKEIQSELEDTLVLMAPDATVDTKERLWFNGLRVEVVDSGEFFRYAIQ